jgi:predicted RNase H-like HicB family nuclease
MRYTAVLERRSGGGYRATCPEVPGAMAEGLARTEVLNRLREEIRFALEVCPCDTTTDGGLELVVREPA